ncbi:hypothetical protein ND861_18675 [Leptospira sp. 2 VSF19]|uniref:Uncharacterized protein n=1 Tax=Leptospira soteropolitanensis TaxID=2950025 RepID=A0AAW5VTJ1_9LEPT|nr:hypothetical protein [Leptospira soteropolitanensis]MCW7494684.1 hypothetical protein [Leptospira soteropolitanensis]MCW7502262.1 hypothetical protein [Leptospira soteropolitanensis]MCW7524507.1 hypothetical protein [Leptospira soteropolitanensis]MCW7528389.1 hypothetical protein [Leptospira soteropolitanensis]MCW7532217.1 hypothetical protein [Leptospira soteropolitanensis]
MKLSFRFSLLIIMIFGTTICKSPELNNGCDPKSNSFLTLLLIKNLTNDRSPGCIPYFDRSEPKFVSYGVFSATSPTEIITAAIHKGKIYIGGMFDQIAATTGGGAFVWNDTSLPVASTYCSQLDVFDEDTANYGTINHAVSDPEGNLYLLGKFTHIQGLPRRNLAKINTNCQLDLEFDAKLNPSSTTFYDLLYLDGRIFFSGSFQTSNGAITNYPSVTNREHVASVNAKTGLIDSWAPNVSGTDVKSMTTDGTFIYIGGEFTAVNSNGAGNLGRLHKDNGSNFYSMVDTNGSVNAMELRDGILYIGGIFSSLNGGAVTRSKLAAIDLKTNTVTSAFSLLVISGNAVFDLAIHNNYLFVAGEISTPRVGIFKTDLQGTVQTSDYSVDGVFRNVYKLSVIDDRLFAFGFFETVRTLDRKYFFQLDILSDEITSFDPKLFNSNYEFNGVALKMKENVIFLGGGFAAIDTRSRNHLVELDLTTGLPSDWNPNPSDLVTNLLVAENRLYIHGSFTTVANTTRQATAAFDLETKALLTWNPIVTSNSIESMIYYNDSIYIAGSFTDINATPVNRIAKLDPNFGAPDTFFAPNPNNTVRSLQIWNDQLFAAGQFTTIPNPSVHLAIINRFNGSFIKTHSDTLTSNFSAYSLFVSDNRLIMSGQYQTTSPNPGYGLSYFQLPDLTSVPNTGSFPTTSEFVRSMDQNEKYIFLGGLFSSFASLPRNGIFSLDRKTLALNNWDPKFSSGATVRKIISSGNAVYVFGNIVNPNKRYRAGLVKLDPDSAFLY